MVTITSYIIFIDIQVSSTSIRGNEKKKELSSDTKISDGLKKDEELDWAPSKRFMFLCQLMREFVVYKQISTLRFIG